MNAKELQKQETTETWAISRLATTEITLRAEDTLVLAFTGLPQNAEWLDPAVAEQLLQATPEANISPEQAARQRGEALLEAHQRVRRASKIRNGRYRVEPQLPPDVLGIYVYLPS